jgi:hypothetical protein
MAHDVFISHSSKDKVYADAVCARLEAEGIRCWIAPRDILPGMAWGEAIVEAIEGSRLMVLLFSSNANASPQVEREVERAINKQVMIVPLRIEQVMPAKSLEYFLGTPHWLDAVSPPFEAHLEYITQTVKILLQHGGAGPLPEVPHPAAPPPSAAPMPPAASAPLRLLSSKPGPVVIGAAAAAVALLAVLGWWMLSGGPVAGKFVGAWTTTNFIGPDKVEFTLKIGDDGSYRYEVRYKESGKVHVDGKGQIYLETADGLERSVGTAATGVVPPTPADLVEAVPDGVWTLMTWFSHTKAQPPQDNPYTMAQNGKPGTGANALPAVWEWDTAFGKIAWQTRFEFGFDGRYSFLAKAMDLGRFEARDGKWNAQSDISDHKAKGSYSFVGNDSLVMAGTLRGAVETSSAGNSLWERVGSAQAAPQPGAAARPSSTPSPSPAPTAVAAARAASSGAATITATPAPTFTPTATATPHSLPIMALDKRFLLSRDTDVYTTTDSSSAVIGRLRRGRWVHITGLTGNWLRIELYNGKEGFIPDRAVE